MEFLVAIASLMSFANLLALAAVIHLLTAGDAEKKQEEACEKAMEELSQEEQRREAAVNEGLENIMSYQVNLGRGKSTGGEA